MGGSNGGAELTIGQIICGTVLPIPRGLKYGRVTVVDCAWYNTVTCVQAYMAGWYIVPASMLLRVGVK